MQQQYNNRVQNPEEVQKEYTFKFIAYPKEAQDKANALNVLATMIPLKDLMFIAGKINKDPKGMVDKLHKFRAFI